jgi:hypothetical protein
VWSDNTNNNNRINLHNIRIIMADKKQKNTDVCFDKKKTSVTLKGNLLYRFNQWLDDNDFVSDEGTFKYHEGLKHFIICGLSSYSKCLHGDTSSRVHDNSTNCSNIKYSENSSAKTLKPSEPKKKKGTQIPDDFDPSREIAENHGLDHEKAIAIFRDWAKGKGHVQADWIATYRNACRMWIKEKMPQSSEPKLKFD